MSKVGTAHIEIKPVLNEDALRELGERIEAEVSAAVARGMAHLSRVASLNAPGSR